MSVRDITILGTSSQQPTRFRNHGACLVRWNDEGFLFDPGEGTQRQFIFADIAPTVITRILVSHFHGDHCLGVPSILMRLNLDKVTHTIHCYYPASGNKYFQRLRHCTMYHENIHVVEHPVSGPGLVEDDGNFKIEAAFLDHGVDTIGWRITEADTRKFDAEKLRTLGIRGPMMKELLEKGSIVIGGREIFIEDVSWIRKGDAIAVISDTRYCQEAVSIAQGAKMLICESTYQEAHVHLAKKHHHLTAKQAASIAKEAGVEELILTHFSARYASSKGFEKEARELFANTHAAEDLSQFPLRR